MGKLKIKLKTNSRDASNPYGVARPKDAFEEFVAGPLRNPPPPPRPNLKQRVTESPGGAAFRAIRDNFRDIEKTKSGEKNKVKDFDVSVKNMAKQTAKFMIKHSVGKSIVKNTPLIKLDTLRRGVGISDEEYQQELTKIKEESSQFRDSFERLQLNTLTKDRTPDRRDIDVVADKLSFLLFATTAPISFRGTVPTPKIGRSTASGKVVDTELIQGVYVPKTSKLAQTNIVKGTQQAISTYGKAQVARATGLLSNQAVLNVSKAGAEAVVKLIASKLPATAKPLVPQIGSGVSRLPRAQDVAPTAESIQALERGPTGLTPRVGTPPVASVPSSVFRGVSGTELPARGKGALISVKPGPFGSAVVFTPQTTGLSFDSFSSGISRVEIRPSDFNLADFTSELERIRFVAAQGLEPTVQNTAEAIRQEGTFDGFIQEDPIEGVGNVFVVTNTEKLNQIVNARSLAKAPEPKRVSQPRLPSQQPPVRRITRTEGVLLRERIRNVARGFREGRVLTKSEIKAVQSKVISVVNKADLSPAVRSKFISRIKNIQTQEQFAKNIDKIRDRVDQLVEEATKREVLSKIRKELSEPIVSGGKSKYSPEVTKILKSYNTGVSFIKPDSLKFKKLNKLAQYVKENPVNDIPTKLLDDLDTLDRKNLQSLTSAELEEQLLNIKSLKTQGKTWKRLTIEKRTRERSAIIEDFNNIITDGRGVKTQTILPDERKKIRKKITESISKFNLHLLNSDTLFDILDEASGVASFSGRIHNKFQNLVNNAKDAEIVDVHNAYIQAQNKLDEFNVEKKLNEMKTIDGHSISGNARVEIYVASHDKARMRSMIQGNNFTPEFISKVIASLGSEERAFGDWLLDFYDKRYIPQNEVFRKTTFMDLPKNEGYSPMNKDIRHVKEDDINLMKQTLNYSMGSVSKGFTKERTGSVSPIQLDAIGNFLHHTNQTAHYTAFELPTKEMHAILKGIKGAIVQEYGDVYYKLLRRWVQDVASDGRYISSTTGKALLALRKNVTKSLLGLNLVTSLKQTISLGGFLTEVSEVALAKGVASYYARKKSWDELWAEVPQIAGRSETLTRDIKEVTRARNAVDTINGVRKGTERTLALIKTMDKLTVRAGATAVYLKNGGKLGEPINKEAMDKVLGSVRRTQPTGDVKDLAALQRGGDLEKLLTIFQNQPNKYYNVMYQNMRGWSKNRIKKGQLARSLLYAWIIPAILFEYMSTGGSAEDEDYAKAIGLGPFRFMLIVGNIVESARTGFDYTASPLEELPKDVKDIIGDVLQGDITDAIWQASQTGAEVGFGIPINQPKRTLTGLYDLVQGNTDDWRRLIYSKWSIGEDKKKKKKKSKDGKIKLKSVKLKKIKLKSIKLK